MPYTLLQASPTDLAALAAAQPLPAAWPAVLPGALPLPFVAQRSLQLAAAGVSLPWSTTYFVVDEAGHCIVGGCGFKHAPVNGRVDVGYGIAPAAQGKGAASAALARLVDIAFEAGATEVLAEIVPANAASIRVVQKQGFVDEGMRVDDDGDLVVLWLKRRAPSAAANRGEDGGASW